MTGIESIDRAQLKKKRSHINSDRGANNHIVKVLHFPYPLLLSCVGLFTTASACALKVRVWPWLRDCCHPNRYDDDLQQRDAEAADPLLVDRASAPASDSGLTGVRSSISISIK